MFIVVVWWTEDAILAIIREEARPANQRWQYSFNRETQQSRENRSGIRVVRGGKEFKAAHYPNVPGIRLTRSVVFRASYPHRQCQSRPQVYRLTPVDVRWITSAPVTGEAGQPKRF